MMKKIFGKALCALLTLTMLAGVCSVGVSAAVQASAGSVVSTYVADFEDNYFSDLSSDTCTSGSIVEGNGGKVLEVKLKSSAANNRFEIHNSSKGTLTLNDGKVYAVTLNYKVVRVGGEGATAPTTIDLVRYTGQGNELVKIKSFPDSTYYPGDTTDWVSQTVIFKAGDFSATGYNRLAINAVSASCPEIETNIDANTTLIQFDNVTVTECTENTKSIEFVTNGGTYCEPILAGAGETVELPSPTRDLYDFDGWYTDIDLTKKFTRTTMPGDMTTKLYAKWKIAADSMTVNYVTNNGETVAPTVGREGDALTLPKLTRHGFNFAGWYDKEYKTRLELTAFPAESMTLYAKWEVIPQLCSFENVDDFPTPNNSTFTQRCIIGDDKYKTSKDKYSGENALHYSFQRGYDLTGSAGKGTPAGVMLVDEAGNKVALKPGSTYVVSFKYKVVKYVSAKAHITLISAGSSGAWSDRKVQDCRLDYDASDVGKGWQSHSFTVEWEAVSATSSYIYIAIAGESEIYVDEILVYEYDKNFKHQGNKMMLCYDTGDAPMLDTVYADRGTEVTLPVLEREGYRFIGWSYDPEGLEPVEGETVTLDKMYTKLYADWFKIPPVTETPDPEPEPEPEPEPTVQPEPEQDNSIMLYIIIAAAVVVAAAVAVVIVIIVKKGKKKRS